MHNHAGGWKLAGNTATVSQYIYKLNPRSIRFVTSEMKRIIILSHLSIN